MQDTEKLAVFGIVEPLATRYGNTLAAQFINGSKIATYPFRPITCTTRDQPTEYAGQDEVHIQTLEPTFVFNDRIMRSLVAEANSIYLTCQGFKQRGSKAQYMQVSRSYRSVVRACLEAVQEAESSLDISQADKTKYGYYVSTLYAMECIWHLCEILYLEQTATHIVVPQLLDWIRFHFPTPEKRATDLILLEREAIDNDSYWPTVKDLVLQGQVVMVRQLLSFHPQAETPAFKMAEQILATMPNCSAQTGFSIQKFRSQWQYWLTDTERKLAANILSFEPELEEIIQLVTGNTEYWNACIQHSEDWYEYMPAYLYYTNPALKHFELGAAANTWLNRWARLHGHANNVQISHLDRVVLSIMENDMHQVLHALQLMGDNKFFVTHLTDLLYNCGHLKVISENLLSECNKLRDVLVYEFGTMLMSSDSLWQLGMNYLEQCGAEGQAAIELLLTRIPIRNERQALKIISIANLHGLANAAEEICKVQSKKSMTDQRYGNALEWAIRSKDATYVTSIADFILHYYSREGEMLCPDVIANVGPKMFISPRLVFLVKYFDFYQLYEQREFLPAAELLVNLLQSKITPEYFWPSLLLDFLPLLEAADPKILSKETCAVLYHLESHLIPLIDKTKKRLEKNPDAKLDALKDFRIENIEEVVTLLRLACARNLSRAIVIENSMSS